MRDPCQHCGLPHSAASCFTRTACCRRPGGCSSEPAEKVWAPSRPAVICLCGSTRFIDVFAVMTWEIETKVGAIVVGCTMLPEWYCQERSHFAEKQGLKEQRDQHHLRKIDLADQVLILNVDGYVGESTRAELAYAREMKKTIWWLEDFADRPAGENVFGPHHNWEIPWKKA